MTDTSPFERLQIPPELVCEFFAFFSRFEFALKDAGFCRRLQGRAAPDWKRFTTGVSSIQIEPKTELDQAIDFLTQEPPLVQVGAHDWEQRRLRGESRMAKAVDAVQRVRNNLFHGGKHTDDSPPGRDEKLVRAALVVLRECLAQNDNLRAAFEQKST